MKSTNFKQTEIGDIPADWDMCVLSQCVSVNPLRNLKRGVVSKYIPMANLLPFERKISGYETKAFAGGMKFINGDTLLARITPCLENGKTAYVDVLGEGEVGFGSTEYIILNGKENLSDSKFVYYLSLSPRFRDIAIKSMVGSSGRQRVQTDKLASSIFAFPKFAEQQQIASVLSSLDDKIELNRKMNKTLEEMGKALFKRWFVDFEFPDENGKPYKSSGGEMVESELGMIPRGWEVGVLDNITEIKNGFAFKSEDYTDNGVFLLRTRNFTQSGYVVKDEVIYLPEPFYKEYSNYQLRQFDVLLVMVGASVGSLGFVTSNALPALQNQNMWNFRARDPKNQLYIKLLVEKLVKQNIGSASGSARDFFRKDFFRTIRFVCPKVQILNTFNEIVLPIFQELDKSLAEIDSLAQLRDSLLPRLMSGKLRVSN